MGGFFQMKFIANKTIAALRENLRFFAANPFLEDYKP